MPWHATTGDCGSSSARRRRGLLGRLGLVDTDADELARELTDQRLAVTHDEDTVFVYAARRAQLERARPAIEAELGELELAAASRSSVEHWLDDEDRWDSEPPAPTVEEETAEPATRRGRCGSRAASHREARELADRLEAEGYGVVRRWSS